MSKREYTHVRLLYPEIKAMIEAGKTQREIAEYYGFKDKYVVKEPVSYTHLTLPTIYSV